MSFVPARLRMRRKLIEFTIAATAVLIACWSCQVNMSELAQGVSKGLDLLRLFFPPAWAEFWHLLGPAAATVSLAGIATPIGAALSIPVALAAARNLSPRWLNLSTRLLLGLERGLPEVVILLFLVIVFGLGPFPAVLALGISSVGMLAKLLADAIEAIAPEPSYAIECVGASRWSVIRYGIVPDLMPSFVANTIFRFDFNIRASVLLGAAGAGGIGFELENAMSSLDYQKATVTILLLIGLTFGAERGGDFLRRRLLGGGMTR